MSKYLISQVDIIGRQPVLRIDDMPRIQTLLGGILCIVIYCCFILASLYFGQELVYRVLPKVIETERAIKNNDIIYLSKEQFLFIFTLSNNFNYLNPNSYLDINLYMKTIENNVISSNPIELGICKLNDFPNGNNDYSSNLDIGNFICAKNLNKNYYIKGVDKFNKYSYLELVINTCSKNNCKTEDEIESILNNFHLSIFYHDKKYDFRKFKDFSNDILNEFDITFTKNFYKKIEVFLGLSKIYTDVGYFFEKFQKQELHTIKKINEYIYDINNSTKYNLTIDFKMDYIKSEIYRKYYKIQNWIAELGGLIRAMTLIASIINYFNDKASYYELLINKLFDVDDIIKYFQFSDSFINNHSKRRKRDSIVLRNAKREKDYFEKGLFHTNSDKKTSTHQTNNFFKKQQLKPKNSSMVNLNAKDDTFGFINAISISNKIENDIKNNLSLPNKEKDVNKSDFSSQNKVDEKDLFIEGLKRNNQTKEHFEKVKSNRFALNCFEAFKFCFKSDKYNPKYNSYIGGRELISERTDLVYILKKNLELDRFKNLFLRDNQLVLLNSLTKFLLDPERVNLIDFETCSYEKFIDCYDHVSRKTNMIDLKLSKWVENKYKLEQHNPSSL